MAAEKFLFLTVNKLCLSVLVMLAAAAVGASEEPNKADQSASAELITLIDRFDGVSARFVQTVVDASLQTLEESSGTLALQRPKFRWQVDRPFAQLIIADGAQLQIYDPDLAQVTVHDIDERLGSTPLTILLGDIDALAAEFAISRTVDGTKRRFLLRPQSETALFLQVELIFQAQLLEALAIWDSAGQLTRIQFGDMQFDQSIIPERFELTLPAGTDVIRG